MNATTLRYEMNPQTGLPELRVAPGVLTKAERRALSAELARRYAQLAERPDGLCRLRTRTRLAPEGRFLVRVRRDHPRLPTLLLTPWPVTTEAASPAPTGKTEQEQADRLEEECAAILLGKNAQSTPVLGD